MTLILAAITRGYAVVASDRRITVSETTSSGQRILSQDDSDTKTVLLDRKYSMGYAGLGRIRHCDETGEVRFRQRMEAWLLDALSGAGETGDYFQILAERCGELFSRQKFVFPHMFLAAGYASVGSRGATDAELVMITNSRRRPHTFNITHTPLGDEKFLLRHVGESLTVQQSRRLKRALSSSVKRRPRQPLSVVDDFVSVMREVAKASEGRVGETFLVTTFPRTAVPLDGAFDVWLAPSPAAYMENQISMTYGDPAAGAESVFHPAVVTREFVAGGMGPGQGPLEGMNFGGEL